MHIQPVYITDLAIFLPGTAIENGSIETVLGMAGATPSRSRRIILRNNKILRRHYAIDPTTGMATHTNAELSAAAVRALRPYPDFTPDDINVLCCGTSSPDQLMPGHASMVHGELGSQPCEVVSTAGICVSGMMALKYGWMSVATGQSSNAVVVGSELASSYLRGDFCRPDDPEKVNQLEKSPELAFEADFLRWMLSDGAGAAYLSAQRPPEGLTLRIDWIDQLSFAGHMETCMYAGAMKGSDGKLRGWRSYPTLHAACRAGAFPIKQDVKLLNQEVITTAVEQTLQPLIAKHHLAAETVDWFLPHYSSEYFRQELADHMDAIGFAIPQEKWFTNLREKGNTGSASIYIILEELFHSGKLTKGEKILCFIPESGRFSMCYMQLTVA